MTKQTDFAKGAGDRSGLEIEVTGEMIEAGVEALYGEMGYQLDGNVAEGVRAVLTAALVRYPTNSRC